MECNGDELLEVLKIICQYEKHPYVHTLDDLLYIDGCQASKKITAYEKERIEILGFEVGNPEADFAFRQKVGE